MGCPSRHVSNPEAYIAQAESKCYEIFDEISSKKMDVIDIQLNAINS